MAVGEERRNSLGHLGGDDRRSERDRRGREGGGLVNCSRVRGVTVHPSLVGGDSSVVRAPDS